MNALNKIEQLLNKSVPVFLHLTFAGLFVFAYSFYLERTIPFDGAFYSTKILAYESFNIENGRWGAIYNQIIPLLGVKMGCSLETFLRLYSVSFVLCNYIIFLVIYYGFKQIYTGTALVLIQVLAYRYNFFYQVSEIHATVGPAFLLFALLQSEIMETRKYLSAGILFALVFWMLNIHLLAFLIILFLIVFSLLHRRSLLRHIPLYVAIGLGLIVFFVMTSRIEEGSYQSEKMISMESVSAVFSDLEKIPGYQHFLVVWNEGYYKLLFYSLVLVCLYYIYRKELLKLLLTLMVVTGFWVIVMANNIKNDSPIVYENYYALFGFFICLPLAVDFFRGINIKFSLPVLVLLVAWSFYQIKQVSIFYVDQIDYFKRMSYNMQGFEEKKFIVDKKSLDWDKIWTDWDFPFQSLLISSLHNRDYSITFYSTNDFSLYTPKIYTDNATFVGPPFEPYWFTSTGLPQKYFGLKNTFYKRMCTDQDTGFHPETFTNQNMSLELEFPEYTFHHGRDRTFAAYITNNSDKVFAATITPQQQIYPGYRVIEANTNKLIYEGRSPLEMDIHPHHTVKTGIKLQLTKIPEGEYIIEVDMVHENKRWFELTKSFKLKVK